MRLTLSMPEQTELKPRITVFGVGGAGGNAVNNMIEKALEGVEFVSANTDAQALAQSRATARVQLGVRATEGLGAGARPEVGAAAAEETIEEIVEHLAGAHMCFITAGMGGGTGTGAAPIIAQAARELGVLTVGVVTKPFQFEGSKRMRLAEQGVEALQKVVDTLIIIPNQNLFRLANEKTTFTEAFALADDVLYQGVKGVTDLMVRPGLINLDFADVRAVMDEMGKAMMGTGEADGADRAVKAAEKAIANPLLDEISLEGARGVLINVTGGEDMTLFELDEAANLIRDKVDPDANIIVGSTLDPDMDGRMRVSVVATGIEADAGLQARPLPRRAARPEPVAEPEPETMADPLPEAEPEPEEVLAAMEQASAHEDERSLFSDLEERAPATPQHDVPGDSIFDDAAAEDDLPQPVYRPAARAPEPRRVATAPAARAVPDVEAPAEGFVAPKPRPAGSPSPETMQRLQTAIAKTSAAGAAQQRRAAAPEPGQRPALAAEGGRKRFGINSLIDRMTGQGAEPGQAQPPRREPRVGHDTQHETGAGAGSDAAHDPEQERIDIPAFLRRQAN